MAVTRVSISRNGKAAINYAYEEKSHKKGIERVLSSSGVNLDVAYGHAQMKAVWDSSRKNDGKSVQVYRIIQSFGLDELDPQNADDIEKANLLGYELAKELYPDRQSMIVTQADGAGGKLHNHIIVNAVSALDGKSLRGDSTKWKRVSDASDKVLESHGMVTLGDGGSRADSNIAIGKMRDAGKYVWKDDLRERIGDVLSDWRVTDRDTFEHKMREQHEVEVKYGKKRVKYSFENALGESSKAGVKALGADYGAESIDKALARNAVIAQEKLEQQRLEREEAERKELAAKQAKPTVTPFLFDVGAELAKVRPRKSEKVTVTKKADFVETDIMREVREEREARKLAAVVNEAHGEALVINADVDGRRAQEQLAVAREEAKRKAEQEKSLKDVEDARKRIEAQEQAKRDEEARKAQTLRDSALKRLRNSISVGADGDVPDDVLTRFMANEKQLRGTMRNTVEGVKLHTVDSIYVRTKNDMLREKRAARNGVPVQELQNDGPEL